MAEPALIPDLARGPASRHGADPSPGVWRTGRLMTGLKARLTVATLTRSPGMIVGTILGGLWGLGVLFMIGTGLFAAAGALPPEGTRATAVLVGAAATVAWWVAAIASGRADATLHASQFALFPLPRKGIALGQVLGALVGIAGPFTLVGLLLYTAVWRLDATAWVTAVVLLPAGWLLMVVGNRCFTALAERLAAKRRVGEILTLLLLVLLMLTGPILTGLFTGVESLGARIYTVTDVVAWTPVGALWAVPADVAAGAWLPALARTGIAAVTLAALLWLWRGALGKSLENATGAVVSGGGRSQVKGAGLFDRLPARPWAAVAARCLTYWVKDPRYSGSLVVVPVMFVLFWFMSGGGGGLWFFAGPLVGLLMAYTISGDVAYDHKGFALHILTGVPGWADRLGRVVGMLLPGIPLTALGVLLAAGFSDAWELLPAMIGVSALALLGGAGLSSVMSARYTYPVPLPGQSPFKTPQGFTVLNVLIQFVALTLMGVLTLPALIPFVIQLVTGSAAAGVISLLVGVIAGPLLCAGGIWLGGRWIEARAPELLNTVSAYR
ncbi:hypothetical protein FCK90_01210 [Kocuria coralli]|uniref:Transporter n=1 Tax=Kocuria coralli TaxID=1461025 RepID=A0A5J5L390_9MICC|nr:hypothetical protein [Kocuria coralli]KAA9395665.1 hypothetical protein FCK90_01210 [Kocuria coralli]